MTLTRIALILLLSTSLIAAYAQDAALTARLTRAATVDALDTLDAEPWHALINVEIFDNKGKNPTNGAIEVWQSGKDRRARYTFAATTLTEVVKGKLVYRTAADPQFPRYAPLLLAKVLHAGPTLTQVNNTLPVLQQQKIADKALDCIATQPAISITTRPGIIMNATQPAIMGGAASSGSQTFDGLPTYCLDAEDHLRATYNSQQTVFLDAPAKFLGHAVARDLSVETTGVPTATAKIVKLEAYRPSADQFMPSSDMPLFVPTVRVSGGVMAGQIVKKVSPIIPAGVSTSGGCGVLHVVVGPDGHPNKVDVVSSSNPVVSAACVDAVKQWVYKPYLLNGEPIQVETTVTINF